MKMKIHTSKSVGLDFWLLSQEEESYEGPCYHHYNNFQVHDLFQTHWRVELSEQPTGPKSKERWILQGETCEQEFTRVSAARHP